MKVFIKCIFLIFALSLVIFSQSWLIQKGKVSFSELSSQLASGSINCEPASLEKGTQSGCFYSELLGLEIEYTLTAPELQSEQKLPYVVFLHGRGGDEHQLRDFCGVDAAKNFFKEEPESRFLVFAPKDPLRSYWKDMASGPDVLRMINEEFVDHIEKNFFVNDKKCISGISMGGHGAVYSALKYPDLYQCMFALSPVFRSFQSLSREGKDHQAFGETKEQFEKRDPYTLIKRKPDGLPPRSVLIIGAQDELLPIGNTKVFFDYLRDYSKYGYFVDRTLKGRHNKDFWCSQMPEAMSFFGDSLYH